MDFRSIRGEVRHNVSVHTGFQARVWIVVERAADLPDAWVAHCLDFDVVSQGNSPQHAIEMLREAVEMVVMDDLKRNADPRSRRAPEAYWVQLSRLLDGADRVSPSAPLPQRIKDSKVFVLEAFFAGRGAA